MAEIFDYLNKYQDQPPKVIKLRVQNYFGLSQEETEEVYNQWKDTYMKPNIKLERDKRKNDKKM